MKTSLIPLVIIPARGGSKGIPHKNIKNFNGKPLICWSIDIAKNFAEDKNIILSTDDTAIADTARQYGLPVEYIRPAELGLDSTGSREVILDAMDWAESHGIRYDFVLLLQPTSPLRAIEDVEKTIVAYSPDIDMAVTVCESPANPYYNCFETDSAGFLHICKGEGKYTRRQDVPPAYVFNGAVYAINPDSIRRMPLGDMPRRIPVDMPRIRSLDLDSPLDWNMAEYIVKLQNDYEQASH